MSYRDEILDAGRKLWDQSPEAARRLGYEYSERLGYGVSESITDASGRIRISRGGSSPGLFGYRSHTWGPSLTIDGVIVSACSGLFPDDDNGKLLRLKLAKAFKPVFDAYEPEKLNAEQRRKALFETERERIRELKDSCEKHEKALIESLA